MEAYQLQNLASNFQFGKNIYVENVRSILNISISTAREVCKELVDCGLFETVYGLVCPNKCCGRIVIEFNNIQALLPKEITCEQCELGGEDKFIFKTDEMYIIEYFKLKSII